MLTQRLRQLERDALVVARPYSERPPRFVYELSAAGHELAGALRLLAGWGARNCGGAAARGTPSCGTPMEARWWCPTCEEPVDEERRGGAALPLSSLPRARTARRRNNARMLRLLGLMISIGLADSLNPIDDRAGAVSGDRRTARARVAEFTVAVFVVYCSAGR